MTWAVHTGDALEVLRTFEAESFDAIVTDPPAGIMFFDQAWDSDKGGRDKWIAWLTDVMREGLRVLKPGGHAFVWALPRTSHWTAMAVENAGFEIRDKIPHVFCTGFPKSLNIAKAIDKKRDDREDILRVTGWLRSARDQAGKTNAEIDALFGKNGMAGHWTSIASQPAVPTLDQWAAIIALLGVEVPADIAAEIVRLNDRKGEHGEAYLEAEVIGEMPTREGPRGLVDFLKHAHDTKIRKPSELAAQWAGWGTALKPAVEDWILARKPLGRRDGNKVGVAENCLTHGVGALNIGATRIKNGEPDPEENEPGLGRWPTNLVFSHSPFCARMGEAWSCPPGCPVAELDAQSGERPSTLTGRAPTNGAHPNPGSNGGASWFGGGDSAVYADSGGASRFFPCFIYEPKASTAETEAGLGAEFPEDETGRRNVHPTKKSLDLMRHFVRLSTRKGGRVLDCFAGSGSTGCACVLEQVDFVGVELDPKFAEIARARIRWWAGDSRALQQSLFEV